VRTPATSSSRWSRSAAALVVVALSAAPSAATAQGGEQPAITATPLATDAPNGGQWFAVEAELGETVNVDVQVANPADVPQTVSLYLADLVFNGAQPEVGAATAGIGAWGAFDERELSLGAKEVVRTSFHVTVPLDAEPGDHIGVVVAESGASGPTGGVGVVKRVASRLYVTVPGDADADLEIDDLAAHLDRVLLPREVTSTFLVRNTGRVRLDVEVTVNGRTADGPTTIVSKSAEAYEATTPLSVWGGRKVIRVRVVSHTRTGEGPTATAKTSVTVIPWWILLAAFLLVVGALTVRELRRRLR
jgi:dihydroorotate dehydrogenase (fumarate)